MSQRGHQHEREERVLELVARHLGGQIVDRPEQPTTAYPGLFTDGVMVTGGGKRWAADVTALTEDPAMTNGFEAAIEHLTPLAENQGIRLRFTAAANTSTRTVAQTLKREIRGQGKSGKVSEKTWEAEWVPASTGTVEPIITAPGTLDATAVDARSLDEQFRDRLVPVIGKKKSQQKRSAEWHLPYGLIFDADGHPGIRQGTPWISDRVQTRQHAIWLACRSADFEPDGTLLVYRNEVYPVRGRYGDTRYELPEIS